MPLKVKSYQVMEDCRCHQCIQTARKCWRMVSPLPRNCQEMVVEGCGCHWSNKQMNKGKKSQKLTL